MLQIDPQDVECRSHCDSQTGRIESVMSAIDPSTSLAFSLFENKGVYALLLGSGLSRAAQIPTGWEITLDLIRRVAALKGVTEEADWAEWHRRQTGAEPSYSEVLDALTAYPDERRSILHSYIEPTADDLREGRKIPTKAHHAIAWLVREGFIRVIVTTNFDRLLETALREAGIEPTVIRSDDDLSGAIPLIHSRSFVLKLHGDYLDTRIKNTDDELSSYSASMNGLLDRILDDHGLVVCEWSGDWDHALRAAIIRTPNRRYPTFWAVRGTVSVRAADLIEGRAAKIIPIIDADSFFAGLQQRIAVQVESQRPNPRNVELLVATVKRHMGRPEFRIQLNDLLAEETRLLARKISGADFPLSGPGNPEEFGRRVMRYEAATEPLARVFGNLGRWGDESAHKLSCDIMGNLAHLKTEGGLNWWLDLRGYPAVLLLYAYGLGALKAGRLDILFRWLTQAIQLDSRDSKPAVEKLLPTIWTGGENDRWQKLSGLSQHKTALSDHLHEVTIVWTADYTLGEQEHTPLFEMFEMFGALAFLTLNATKAELEEAHALQAADRNFVWSPIGRIAWHSEMRNVILTKLEQPEMRSALLAAGFGRGKEEHLKLAIESVTRLMGRISWW
jgi:hypothetical protein